jgi:tetratricopeptide (TPR) repeat protein
MNKTVFSPSDDPDRKPVRRDASRTRRIPRWAALSLMAAAWFSVGFLVGRGAFWTRPAADSTAWQYPPAEIPPEATAEHRFQLQQVREVVHGVLDAYPSCANAVAALAVLHYLCYDSVAEAACWERCLELDPTFGQAYSRLVALSEQAGDYEQVVDLMRRAQDYPSALDDLQREQHLGSALVQLRRFDEAREVLERLVDRQRRAPEAYLLLGEIFSRQEDLLKARDSLETALAQDPGLIDALYRLSMVCSKLGERERAARYRARFDAIKSAGLQAESASGARHQMQDDTFVPTRLGESLRYASAACMAHDDPEGAEVCLLQAVVLDARNAEARRLLAELYLRTNRQLARARQLIEESVALEPTPRALLVQAALAERTGDVEGARRTLEKVLALDPDQQEYRVLYESLSRAQ